MKRAFLFLLLLTIHGLVAAEVIKIGVLVNKNQNPAVQNWQATADYLNEKIAEYDFQVMPFELIGDMRAAVKQGQLHFFITQPIAYMELETNYGASRLLTLVKQNGQKHYSSVIFTRTDHPDISAVGDLKERSFAAVDPLSLGGWLMAKLEMIHHGLNPDEDLANLQFLTSPQRVIDAVIDGDVDAGTIRTGILDEYLSSRGISPDQIRIINPKTVDGFPFIFSTDIYPEWVFAKTSLEIKDLAEKVTSSLLDMPAGHEGAVRGHYERWTVPANFQKVTQFMHELDIGEFSQSESLAFPELFKKYLAFIAGVVLVLLLHSYYALRTRFLNAELRSEIDQKDRLHKKIQQIATCDELTGLPNRKLTLQMLRREIMRSHRSAVQLALLFIDLHGFRQLNEHYGHAEGDRILQEVGEVFKKTIRGNDLAGRIGGDEFIVLLSDLNHHDNASVVARKLSQRIGKINIENKSGLLSAKIGIVVFIADETLTTESLLSSAESMLQKTPVENSGEFNLLDLGKMGSVAAN